MCQLELAVQPAGSSGGPEAGEEHAGWKGLSSWPISAGLRISVSAVFSCLQYLSFSLHGKTSLVAQLVKNLPAMRETWVQSLGWGDPWRRERPPTPVFYYPGLENSMDCVVDGVAKSRTGLSGFHFTWWEILSLSKHQALAH